MSLHTDAAAVDTAIAALESAVADLQTSAIAADQAYRAANHGHEDPVNSSIVRYVAAGIMAQPTLAKMLGGNQRPAFTLADVWPA